jgi:hypothetical protein
MCTFNFWGGDVKSIPKVMFSPSIKKNLLSVGFIADQNHRLEFVSEGSYIRDRNTNELVAFAS